MDSDRVVVVVVTLVGLGWMTPLWYFMIFQRIRKEWHRYSTRARCLAFHVEAILCAIFIPLSYLVFPGLLMDEVGKQGMRLLLGSAMLLGVLGMRAVRGFRTPVFRTYHDLIAVSMLAGGAGLFYKSFCWLLEMRHAPFLVKTCFAASLVVLCLAEIGFLSRNGWKAVPIHPR